MTRNGAIAGMIGGGPTVLIWKHLEGGLFDLYEIVPGFIVSVLLIGAVSLLDRKPSSEITARFSFNTIY